MGKNDKIIRKILIADTVIAIFLGIAYIMLPNFLLCCPLFILASPIVNKYVIQSLSKEKKLD